MSYQATNKNSLWLESNCHLKQGHQSTFIKPSSVQILMHSSYFNGKIIILRNKERYLSDILTFDFYEVIDGKTMIDKKQMAT